MARALSRQLDEIDLKAADRAYRLSSMGLRVDGTPFSLRDYPWNYDLLNEEHPSIVIRKGAQLGLTVTMILRVIDMSMYLYPRGVLYLMPTRDDVSDFSKTRFDRFLKENNETALGKAIAGTDSINVKKVGQAFVYFRGARSRSQLKSIPVDALYTDEEDEMPPEQVDLAEHRLDGSRHKHHGRLSTPSIPDAGVDYYYNRSDQRMWMVRCEACGKHTCLEDTWPDCFEKRSDGTWYRACQKCKRELDLRFGEWVATRDGDYRHRGYYISQLCSPTIDPTVIMEEWLSGDLVGEKLKEFMNSRLGLPYADLEDLLTEQVLREACAEYPKFSSDEGPCFMGADIGKKDHHYFVAKKTGERSFEVLDYGMGDFNLLSDKIRRFHVSVGVFDMMAEMHAVRAFQKAHPQIWGSIYSEAQRNAYEWQPKELKVTSNRTEILDESHHYILRKDVILPRPMGDWTKFVKQMTNLARTVVRDEKTGTPKVRWIVRGRKNDHYRHAWALTVLASKMASMGRSVRKARRRKNEKPEGLTFMSS